MARLNENLSLVERLDAFLQIVARVSVLGEPVYTIDSYEVDRRRGNSINLNEECLTEMQSALKKIEETQGVEFDNSFCLGILLLEILGKEECRGVDHVKKILDLILSGAEFYEFGVMHIDEKLADINMVEEYKYIGSELTRFNANKRMLISELQERLYKLFGDTKCNIRFIDAYDEGKELFVKEIRYSGFKNVIVADMEKNSSYRPVKNVEFYVRAIETTISVKAECVDDTYSEYREVDFPEDTLLITFQKSFYYVYENDFSMAKRISISLGKSPEEDLKDYIEECLSLEKVRKVFVSTSESSYEILKKNLQKIEAVKLYPESVVAARYYRKCYENTGKRLLYVGIGEQETELCILENNNGEDIGIKLELSREISSIKNINYFIANYMTEKENQSCVINYCESTVDDVKNSERVDMVKSVLGTEWSFLTGRDVLAKGLALCEMSENKDISFDPDAEELGIMLKDVVGHVYFNEMRRTGQGFEITEKMSNIPSKMTIWARKREASPYKTALEMYGNELHPVFRISINYDKEEMSELGKTRYVLIKFDFSDGDIYSKCHIEGIDNICIEKITEERDYSWIKRFYK